MGAMAKLLLSPRWLAGHALVLVLVSLFVYLGLWQWERHLERRSQNALLAVQLEAAPVPLDAILAEKGREGEALRYRRVAVSGRYDAAHEVLLRSRAYEGQPGYHVLTPLVLDERGGRALLVERGWVPYELDRPPIEAAAPPGGEVQLVGMLHASQRQPEGFAARFAARDPEAGPLTAVFYVDTARLARQLPYALEPFYLTLEAQQPPQPGPLPAVPPKPVLDDGPHLGYAIQWFAFALVGLIGYPLLLRQVLREARRPPAEG